MQSRKKNEGISIVGILLIGVVAIFVLSYFKIDIKGVVESPTAQENVGYVKEGSKTVWEKYLKEPAEYLWNDIFVDLLWKAFVNNLERVRDGQPTDIELASPQLPQ